VRPEEVELVPGKGSSGRGDGPGGEFWTVKARGKRAGVVFVNVYVKEPFGSHAAIEIYLNIASQGQGIGSVAYRLAAEASRHEALYAHMSPSNAASKRAAGAAGFVDSPERATRQWTMVWRRRTEPSLARYGGAAAGEGEPVQAADLPADAGVESPAQQPMLATPPQPRRRSRRAEPHDGKPRE
jgi:hypothetical protein